MWKCSELITWWAPFKELSSITGRPFPSVTRKWKQIALCSGCIKKQTNGNNIQTSSDVNLLDSFWCAAAKKIQYTPKRTDNLRNDTLLIRVTYHLLQIHERLPTHSAITSLLQKRPHEFRCNRLHSDTGRNIHKHLVMFASVKESETWSTGKADENMLQHKGI